MHLALGQPSDGVGVLEAVVAAGRGTRVCIVLTNVDVPRDLLAPGDDMNRDDNSRITNLATQENINFPQTVRDTYAEKRPSRQRLCRPVRLHCRPNSIAMCRRDKRCTPRPPGSLRTGPLGKLRTRSASSRRAPASIAHHAGTAGKHPLRRLSCEETSRLPGSIDAR